jgi:capsular polysaccharide transport system permease protein
VAGLPAAEQRLLPDSGVGHPLGGNANRAVVTPASATVLPVPSEGGGRTVVFDHRRSSLGRLRRRSRLGWFSFIIVVAVPVVTAAVYYFFVAADQYVAEFRFALRSAEPERHDPVLFFQESIAPSVMGLDSYVVVQYLASRAIIDDLSTTVDLREMFSRSEADWPVRLDLPVSIEELVRYWKRQVDAFFDATNGTIVVRARAFAPQDALKLAEGILASSERLVNELSARARRDALRNADEEVGRAEKRLKSALTRLREFRDKEGIIDPRKTADATVALAGRVRDELVRAGTELSTLKHYMRDDAPSIKMLEARVQSLEAQRRAVESEVTDTEKTRSEALSRIMGSYEQLESERAFAENTYQHALQALDRSRINADRQQVYLATFVQPTLPEEALYPRRLQSFAVASGVAFVVWMIGGFILQSIRDHLGPQSVLSRLKPARGRRRKQS